MARRGAATEPALNAQKDSHSGAPHQTERMASSLRPRPRRASRPRPPGEPRGGSARGRSHSVTPSSFRRHASASSFPPALSASRFALLPDNWRSDLMKTVLAVATLLLAVSGPGSDRPDRRGRCHLPLPDLLEVVLRVQQDAPERPDQLPVHRLGRRASSSSRVRLSSSGLRTGR